MWPYCTGTVSNPRADLGSRGRVWSNPLFSWFKLALLKMYTSKNLENGISDIPDFKYFRGSKSLDPPRLSCIWRSKIRKQSPGSGPATSPWFVPAPRPVLSFHAAVADIFGQEFPWLCHQQAFHTQFWCGSPFFFVLQGHQKSLHTGKNSMFTELSVLHLFD